MKVLHVPTNVGANPMGLARAERALGLDSHAIAFEQTVFDMDIDQVLWPKGLSIAQKIKRQWDLLNHSMQDYDVIHYNAGKTIAALPLPRDDMSVRQSSWWIHNAYSSYATLLQNYELRRLRQLNKPYFVTYQGSDARQSDYCLRNHEITFYNEPECILSSRASKHNRTQIAKICTGAQKVYALNPDLLDVLPERSEFLPYASVDVDAITRVPLNTDRPRIVHAPSKRWVKGTKYIVAAIEQLKLDGYNFDFELLESRPHSEVLKAYAGADLLIDQLLAGWYGAASVEAMAFGKPVACYLREKDLDHLPRSMREELPVVSATPDTVYRVLREFLSKPMEEWQRCGDASRAFVERWHNPMSIARRLQCDYRAAVENVA